MRINNTQDNTFTARISVINGNSDQWSNTYTVVNSNSASWSGGGTGNIGTIQTYLSTNNVLLNGATVTGNVSASGNLTVHAISSRFIDLLNTPANDGFNPVLKIGETDTTGFSGFNLLYNENQNKLHFAADFGGVSFTAISIDRNGGVAEGANTVASGIASHAQGSSSIASGNYSFAAGESTLASGIRSTAIGINSSATAVGAIALGRYAAAINSRTFVWQGRDTTIPFSSTRADQFAISANGGVYLVGNVGINTDDNVHALNVRGNVSITGTVSASNKWVYSDPTLVPSSPAPGAIVNIVTLSQAAYNALGSYSSTTLYIIV